MDTMQIIVISFAAILFAVLLVHSIFLIMGKGANLIAGYNTLSKEKKAEFNEKGLCKFVGLMMIPINLLLNGMIISIAFGQIIAAIVCGLAFMAVGFFAIFWANYKYRKLTPTTIQQPTAQ